MTNVLVVVRECTSVAWDIMYIAQVILGTGRTQFLYKRLKDRHGSAPRELLEPDAGSEPDDPGMLHPSPPSHPHCASTIHAVIFSRAFADMLVELTKRLQDMRAGKASASYTSAGKVGLV